MQRGVLQALNALSIHVKFRAFGPGVTPGETKMWSPGDWNLRFSTNITLYLRNGLR